MMVLNFIFIAGMQISRDSWLYNSQLMIGSFTDGTIPSVIMIIINFLTIIYIYKK